MSNNKLLTTEKQEIINHKNNKFTNFLFLPICTERQAEGGLRTKGLFKKSYENKPLISIITVIFNGEKYLEETIKSVITQSYENIEYIIIDGGSTDGTLDIIKKYENKIDYWISEKDYGLYHAMNRGISATTGEIIGMINSDDFYYPDAFQKVINAFSSNKDIELFFGDLLRDGDLRIKGWNEKYIKLNSFAAHPSMFVRRETYLKKTGLYKLQYRISSDYDFIYRAFNILNLKKIYLAEPIAFFRLGGISSKQTFRAYTEEMLIKIDNGEKIYKALSWYLIKLIRWLIIK